MGYSCSYVYTYNEIIESSYSIENLIPILGKYINDYLADTPTILSQYNHNINFETVNDALMARKTSS